MANETKVTTIVDTKYKCKCGTTYHSKEEAERCPSPREPRFNVGDWVEANQNLTLRNPAYDHGFGDEAPFDCISKGTVARIKAVHDSYDDKIAFHPRQYYSYSFDKGERPMTYNTIFIKEADLVKAGEATRTRIKERIKTLSTEVRGLEEIVEKLKK